MISSLATMQSIMSKREAVAKPVVYSSYSSAQLTAMGNSGTNGTSYTMVQCSTNGQYIYISANSSVYYSNNSGSSFGNISNFGGKTGTVYGVACSDNGAVVWVGVGAFVMCSTDYGSTWTVISNVQINYHCIDCDSTGNYGTYAIYSSSVFLYNRTNSTQYTISAATNVGWMVVKMSRTSNVILISGNKKGGAGASYIGFSTSAYNSTSFPLSALNDNSFDCNVGNVGMADDGNKIIIPIYQYNTGVWIVNNKSTSLIGSSTYSTLLPQSYAWTGATVQRTQNFIAVVGFDTTTNTGYLYFSTNYGTSFTSITLPYGSFNGILNCWSYSPNINTVYVIVVAQNSSVGLAGVYRYQFNFV